MTAIFMKIVNMSISASYLVAVVLVLRLILRRAPKWSHVLLWGLVAVRLSCPFTWESAVSLIPNPEPIPEEILLSRSPEIDAGIPIVNAVINPILTETSTPQSGASVNPLQVYFAVGGQLWLCGMIGMAVYTVVSYLRLRYRVRRAVRVRENIFESDAVGYPFVLGLFAPRIYLPAGMPEAAMPYVIAHEEAHIRRVDFLWKPLGFLLLTVHWFNPLIWVAYILLCRDIELACDERVIRTLEPPARADYSEALLRCSVSQMGLSACPLAFGEVGLKQRVKSVLSYRKPAVWVVTVAVVACTIVAVCFLSNPTQENNPPLETTQGEVETTIPMETTVPAETTVAQPPETTKPLETTAPPTPQTPVYLTKVNAQAVIEQILATLVLHSDHTVSFAIPENLPVAEDGKTDLWIVLKATFVESPGNYAVQSLYRNERGWQGGETPRLALDMTKGTLSEVTLSALYMTEVNENRYQQYAQDAVSANAPFTYDTPVKRVTPGVIATQEGQALTVAYTFTDGTAATMSMTLPEDIIVEAGENFDLHLTKNGQAAGGISLYDFAARDEGTLASLNTAENAIPMPIFALVAASNHSGYENYRVISHTDTGAVAVADFVWQDLSQGMPAAALPWNRKARILAYDYSVMPYFVEIAISDGICSEAEREMWSASIGLE